MEKDWKIVYENPNEVRIGIVKAVLEDSQIPTVVVSKKDSSYQFGSYEVYVNQKFVIQAIRIIQHDLEFE
jgi:Putative prokaryotic signal transducing protein